MAVNWKSFMLMRITLRQIKCPVIFLLCFTLVFQPELSAQASGAVVESYSYDAYGNARFDTSNASTHLLYAGEMLDSDLQQYYLRERWYSPSVGRFNRLDPYSGNNLDPQSLHKYNYTNANPVNAIDPTGCFTQAFGYLAEAAIQDVYDSDHIGDVVLYGKWTRLGVPGVSDAFRLKPDIFNITKQKWLEIKPLSPSGIGSSGAQYQKYLLAFAAFGYSPEVSWTPSTHFTYAGGVNIFFFNAGGIVFYTDLLDLSEDLVLLASLAAVKKFAASRAGLLIARSLVGVASRIPALVSARVSIDANRLRGHTTMAITIGCLGKF